MPPSTTLKTTMVRHIFLFIPVCVMVLMVRRGLLFTLVCAITVLGAFVHL